MLDLILDMETGDPDDVMTLCLAIHNSQVNLRAVTVTPGTDEQIGLVKHILDKAGVDIPVGSHRIGYDKNCVSGFHYKWLGKFDSATPDDEGHEIITETLRQFPETTLLTGAPLKNMSAISTTTDLTRWVAQGGFAGDNVVPEAYRLEKFAGKITCPTFNFNGDPTTAVSMLASERIKEKYLVSKNVCHGIIYDQEMHEYLSAYRYDSAAMNIVYKGMETYLKKKPMGKKFHDPLALAVAINPSVCEFREVEMYRKGGSWGARLQSGTNTYISICGDKDKMMRILADKED